MPDTLSAALFAVKLFGPRASRFSTREIIEIHRRNIQMNPRISGTSEDAVRALVSNSSAAGFAIAIDLRGLSALFQAQVLVGNVAKSPCFELARPRSEIARGDLDQLQWN